MSVPAKKAAEAVAKKVIPAASRAVAASEASSIAPTAKASDSPEDAAMPWDGWVSSFVASKIGTEKFDKLRSYFVFRPDDPNDLEQIPKPYKEFDITEDGSTKAQFRYPSPGSQAGARVPTEDKGTLYEDPFFVSYAPRDTARRYQDPAFPNEDLERLKLELLPQDDERVIEAKEKFEEGARSSPGNNFNFATGKSDYDTTGGLRATMSTNHATLEKSLDDNMPDHLPMPEWWDKQEEIVAWYKEHDLPVPLGATGYGTIPREGRIARW